MSVIGISECTLSLAFGEEASSESLSNILSNSNVCKTFLFIYFPLYYISLYSARYEDFLRFPSSISTKNLTLRYFPTCLPHIRHLHKNGAAKSSPQVLRNHLKLDVFIFCIIIDYIISSTLICIDVDFN